MASCDVALQASRADWPTSRLGGGGAQAMACGSSTVTVKVTGKAAVKR